MVHESTLPRPTADNPLGIPPPGFTWSDGKIWVEYLIKTWPSETPLLVYDLAQGGDTVQGMAEIIEDPYQELLRTHGKCYEHWKPASTLFVFWIGINDLAFISNQQAIDDRVAKLFDCVQLVYNSGARSFLFIDVPPVNRSPIIVKGKHDNDRSLAMAPRFHTWNKCLDEKVQEFSRQHTDAACFQFSAFNFLARVLDDPTTYGFQTRDARNIGAIWKDHIHLSSSVHEKLAKEIQEYLLAV